MVERDALVESPVVKQLVDGEGLAYLGRSRRLLIDEATDTVQLDRGRFLAPPATWIDGSRLMREYVQQLKAPSGREAL
ncbi:MAG: hypothetical protein GY925_29040 [Actinomycetia bacterium]|nr:hypothetical protein [Actinomycetes bacterium]